jgi:D-aminopeptidase
VVNGTLVLDNNTTLVNDTDGSGLNLSVFTLGAVTNLVSSSTYTYGAGVLTATNNNFNAAVYLGDAANSGGNLSTVPT